jgi:proline iminopeptidase
MYILLAVLAVLIPLVLYAAYAYHAYNRFQPVERPCLDCLSPVTVNGYDLYYRELGVDKNLSPIILVHGGPGHSSLSFKNSFDFLSIDRRVIYYDQRGSGNSQVKPNLADFTIDQLVDELEVLRCDVVHAQKVILIGHSFGSALVQRYALRYPQNVEKMVIIGGIRINNGMKNFFVWKWLGPMFYSISLGFPPAQATAVDTWFTQSMEKDNPKRLFDPSTTHLLAKTGRISFAPWRAISLSLVGYDFKSELRQLHIPALFIYGVADSRYTSKPVAAELCAALPNCQSIAFDKSGHWPFLEQPERFQEVVRAFLATH